MKVKLLKPLTDAGCRHEPGSTIELDADTAQWVIEQGVGEAVKASFKKVAAPAEDKE